MNLYSILIMLTISSPIFGIIFDCSYSYHSYILINRVYTCYAEISDTTESNVLIDVVGLHQQGKDNSDVNSLEMKNAIHLSFIPQGIETFFPKLRALIIENHSIVELEGDELRSYNGLKLFGLINGKLKKISGDLFESTPHMTHLWLSKNEIRNVSESFANFMENLMFSDLSGNECINQQATNPYEMSDLSENLRMNCTEANVDAVIVPRVMMEALVDEQNEKKCEKGNEIERICKLEKENEVLHMKIKELVGEIESLRGKLVDGDRVEEAPVDTP